MPPGSLRRRILKATGSGVVAAVGCFVIFHFVAFGVGRPLRLSVLISAAAAVVMFGVAFTQDYFGWGRTSGAGQSGPGPELPPMGKMEADGDQHRTRN